MNMFLTFVMLLSGLAVVLGSVGLLVWLVHHWTRNLNSAAATIIMGIVLLAWAAGFVTLGVHGYLPTLR